MIKRGIHTLRMDQYQLLYCDGVMGVEEQQRSKIVRASEEFGKRRR